MSILIHQVMFSIFMKLFEIESIYLRIIIPIIKHSCT